MQKSAERGGQAGSLVARTASLAAVAWISALGSSRLMSCNRKARGQFPARAKFFRR